MPKRLKNGQIRLYELIGSAIGHNVNKDTQEYNFAMAQFCRLLNTPPSAIQRVVAIEYDESCSVKMDFENMKQSFAADNLTGEVWVFHGTEPSNITPIISEGFKVL